MILGNAITRCMTLFMMTFLPRRANKFRKGESHAFLITNVTNDLLQNSYLQTLFLPLRLAS